MIIFKYKLQEGKFDCGETCLNMIFQHYIKYWPAEETKRLLKCGESKVTLLALRSAVRKLGFKSEGIVLSVKELSTVMLPAILHLRSDHYVVLFHIENDIYFIADPLVGIREYTMKDLYKYWTVDNTNNGHVLTIDPYVNFEGTT